MEVFVDADEVASLVVPEAGLCGGDDGVALAGGAVATDDVGQDDGVLAPAVADVVDELGVALVSVGGVVTCDLGADGDAAAAGAADECCIGASFTAC